MHKNQIQRTCAELSDMLVAVINTIASEQDSNGPLSADRQIDHLRGAESHLLSLRRECDRFADDDAFWKNYELMFMRRINRQNKTNTATVDQAVNGTTGNGHIATQLEGEAA